jgi:hypothetical protein
MSVLVFFHPATSFTFGSKAQYPWKVKAEKIDPTNYYGVIVQTVS